MRPCGLGARRNQRTPRWGRRGLPAVLALLFGESLHGAVYEKAPDTDRDHEYDPGEHEGGEDQRTHARGVQGLVPTVPDATGHEARAHDQEREGKRVSQRLTNAESSRARHQRAAPFATFLFCFTLPLI